MARKISIITAVLCLLFAGVDGAFAAGLTQDDVYFGNYRQYKAPAEVNAKKIFLVIPAYREIIDKKIEKDSALYVSKLEEATKAFVAAISSYAEANKYDLVCEESHISGAPNATEGVLKVVKEHLESKK